MEFAFLLVLFFVVSLIQQAVQKNKGGRARSRRPRVPPPDAQQQPREQPQSLRDLFAEVRRQMEEAQRQAEPTASERAEAAALEDVEERESLEVVPIATSLETVPVLVERPVVDLDDQADAVIRRRLKWAEEHARGRTAADHKAFDERIRRKPPPRPKISRSDAPDLRRMVIWREVLGRPLALRDDWIGRDRPS